MKKTNGFTLIELMIVVAIIGILVAVGSSAFKNDGIGINHNSQSKQIHPKRVDDRPDVNNCTALPDSQNNRTIYSCPDGKIYTM